MNIEGKIKLSICIPVYNNAELLNHCLKSIEISIISFEEYVEIIISDNASEDSISELITKFKEKNRNIRLIYSRNETNRGLAYNFHKVVEMANGQFCWIIGSDDFVTKNGIASIMEIINSKPNIAFIGVAFGHLDLQSIYDKNNLHDPYSRVLENIEDGLQITYNTSKIIFKEVEIWDKLVDPYYKNTMLGSVMAGVFRRNLWIEVNRSCMDKTMNFNNVENIYPHCAIYSKSMIGKPACFISNPAVIVGDGARLWTGESFWDGSLPVMYLKVLNEIIDLYKKGGLNKIQLLKCRFATGSTVGRYMFPFFRRKYIQKKDISNSKYISLITAYKKNWYTPTFYLGFIEGFLKSVYKEGIFSGK